MIDKSIYIENWTPIAYCHNKSPGVWFDCESRPIDTTDEAREMVRAGILLMANRRDDKAGVTYVVVKSSKNVVGLIGFNKRMKEKYGEAAE